MHENNSQGIIHSYHQQEFIDNEDSIDEKLKGEEQMSSVSSNRLKDIQI